LTPSRIISILFVGGILRTVLPHFEKLRAEVAAFVALDSAPAAMACPFQMIKLILSNEYISGGAKAKCWLGRIAAGVLGAINELAGVRSSICRGA
jgi:hypothetical protein